MRINIKLWSCFAMAALSCTLVGGRAEAQSGYSDFALKQYQNQNSASRYSIKRFQNQAVSRGITRTGVGGVNRQSYGASNPNNRRSKPFENINRGPSVTPYLALSNSFNQVSDYYNIVKPQQEQARANEKLQRQSLMNQRRLNQIAAQGPYDVQGDPDLAPTGHSATYMYFDNFGTTGGFFPAPQGLEKRE